MRMGRSDRQQFNSRSLREADQLVLGREAYEERAWDDAYRFLSHADEAGAALEWQAARTVFQQVGAMPDVSRLDTLLGGRSDEARGLSVRELQVLRLIAAGKTNKQIANDLHLSGKTVDRHVSNIVNKIEVPNRAVATAWAYEHGLVRVWHGWNHPYRHRR
jgi:DNA-binding NarL/FixJ family response regulator